MNELNDKIKEIGSMFGISELPDNIGDIISSFLGVSSESKKEDEGDIGSTNSDISDIEKILPIVNKYFEIKRNSPNDRKIKLLYAIEPFLSDKRKDKIDICIKFLTFTQLAKEFKNI